MSQRDSPDFLLVQLQLFILLLLLVGRLRVQVIRSVDDLRVVRLLGWLRVEPRLVPPEDGRVKHVLHVIQLEVAKVAE